jgi:Uma2 family endonuclease
VSRIVERTQLSAVEFLEWERDQPTRHEFFRGEVFAMAGGSPRHNALCSRFNAALRVAFADRGCEVFSSDQRIGLGPGERYVYPDVTVVCGQLALEPGTTDVLTNPSVLVEVLSGSTEQYDRGLKWEGYQRVQSLMDYVLVSQTEPRVEHYRREAAGSWIYRSLGPGQHLVLSGQAELELDVIFAGAFDLPGD